MATFSKTILSASTDGRGLLVNATSSPGDTIHTAPTDSDQIDEIWIYAYNSHSADVDLTIEWGGTTAPDDVIKQTIPLAAAGNYKGLVPVIEGQVLRGNATPLVVTAYASVADKITLFGFVNGIAV